MGISRHNKFKAIDWGVNTDGWQFKKVAELIPNEVYPVKGCFITGDNGYGEGAVLISNGYLVNIPPRYVEIVREIMNSADDIEQIKSGKCGFRYSEFTPKNYPNRVGYDVEFIDL